jgi:hypothetical protein
MTFCYNCGQQLTTGTEKFCPNCGKDLNSSDRINVPDLRGRINITDLRGDVIGVGVSGSGNIIGKNIVVGSGTINVSQQELAKIQDPGYARALKDFSENINQQLKGKQLPEEQTKFINKIKSRELAYRTRAKSIPEIINNNTDRNVFIRWMQSVASYRSIYMYTFILQN